MQEKEKEKEGKSNAPYTPSRSGGVYLPSICRFTRAYMEEHSAMIRISPVSPTHVEQCPLQCFTGAAKEVRPLLIILRSFNPIKPFASPSVKKIPTIPSVCTPEVCAPVISRHSSSFERSKLALCTSSEPVTLASLCLDHTSFQHIRV